MPFGLNDRKELGFYLSLSQVGMEMAGMIALGWALDASFGWAPWGIITGAVLGLVGGLFHLVTLLNRREKEQEAKTRRDAP